MLILRLFNKAALFGFLIFNPALYLLSDGLKSSRF